MSGLGTSWWRMWSAGLAIVASLGVAPQARAQESKSAPIVKAATSIGAAARTKQASRVTDRFDDTFRKYTKRYFGIGFDWIPFKAQGMAESNLTPTATSWVGARGVMQLMPSTFAAIQSKRPEFKSIDDPEWNIAAGIMHDRYLWKRYQKDVPEDELMRFMFASYNAGEGTIDRARTVAEKAQLDRARWESIAQVAPTVQRWRYRETLDYVRKIEVNLDKLKVTKR